MGLRLQLLEPQAHRRDHRVRDGIGDESVVSIVRWTDYTGVGESTQVRHTGR